MKNENAVKELNGIPATLLIPLWARAEHTKSPDNVVADDYAASMIRSINFDFEIFEKMNSFVKAMTISGVAARTLIFDNAVRSFMEKYPDGVVLNVGCGLDARFFRLDNGKVNWFDLDVGETIELRKSFFEQSDRYRMVNASILNKEWIDELNISAGTKVLILSEGTLMYFDEEKVKDFVSLVISKFPDAELHLEVIGEALKDKVHYTVKILGYNDLTFPWAMDDYSKMENWTENLRYSGASELFDVENLSWTWLGNLIKKIPVLRKKMGSSIVHFNVMN
ncbi:MAG: class I SAM-dependent methyltransferase [Rhodothermaceae bacterium]